MVVALLLVLVTSTQLVTVRSFALTLPSSPSRTCDAPQYQSVHRRKVSPLRASNSRGGATARRKKQKGKGFGQTTPVNGEDAAFSSADKIYSIPPLYDLAFGYRDYEDEVAFLLAAHREHAGPQAATAPLRVLELAAGPARHALAALAVHPPSAVAAATALDRSRAMVDYGLENADRELGAPGGRRDDFAYLSGDMRRIGDCATTAPFDTAWLLLGSLGHLLANADAVACLASLHAALAPGGTAIVELPHPRETFCVGECTRDGWRVPLAEAAPDEEGGEREYGALDVVWGEEGDEFDPVQQIRHLTVGLKLTVNDVESLRRDAGDSPLFARMSEEGKFKLKEVVPTRLYTLQEIDALARCAGFELVATYGALAEVSIEDEDEAFRMVCVLRKC